MSDNEIHDSYVQCPFCKERDFDLAGLKYHFAMGYCEIYSRIDLVKEWSHSVRKDRL